MTSQILQQFELTVDRSDMILGDGGWLPDYLAEMGRTGFSMKGGLYIGMTATCTDNDELVVFSYVPVARREQRIEREPTNGHEASLPEFMEYMAFPTGGGDCANWGVSMVNALISANRGKLPEKWLEAGLSELDYSKNFS